MEFFGLTFWQWAMPLLLGIVAGLATNAVAIWMLFHPYEPLYLGPLRVLPKGAIPKEIDRIARRIGETVGNELLTPDDIARTLSSPAFRDRFDEVLRDTVQSLLDRELGSLREMVPAEQRAGLQQVLERALDRLREGIEIYLRSPEWEARVRGFAHQLTTDFRDRPLSVVLTPELQADLVRAARELWGGVRESDEFRRVVAEAVDRAITNTLSSDKPLREYVPSGAVNLGEAVVSQYLPILLERLGQVLDEPTTRARLQAALRRFTDRFLEEQRAWKRIVGRLVITERTLAQTVEAIEQGGVEEIAALLREPEVQARVAQALNEGVDELLDKPVRELFGRVSPERAERLRTVLVDRVIYLFRHSTTEQVVLGRLDAALGSAAGRTVGDVMDLLGPERSGLFADRLADWVLEAMRGPRATRVLERFLARQTTWMLSVRIGRIGQYLPDDAAARAEALLFDPLWSFIQRRVPQAVAELPVAGMVEEKLRAYPIQKVEELIWRVSQKELVLIIYLGGFLGALVGSLMLLTTSWPAGLITTGFFLLLSFAFINLKG
jgi:uncharacterized membrane protein YheB (UPF0754 family)